VFSNDLAIAVVSMQAKDNHPESPPANLILSPYLRQQIMECASLGLTGGKIMLSTVCSCTCLNPLIVLLP
jgi:hypothetical protein